MIGYMSQPGGGYASLAEGDLSTGTGGGGVYSSEVMLAGPSSLWYAMILDGELGVQMPLLSDIGVPDSGISSFKSDADGLWYELKVVDDLGILVMESADTPVTTGKVAAMEGGDGNFYAVTYGIDLGKRVLQVSDTPL